MSHVVQRIWHVDGEGDQDDVCFGVCERSESLVVFLTGGIPKSELHGFAVDAAIRHVVFEDGGDVMLDEARTKSGHDRQREQENGLTVGK